MVEELLKELKKQPGLEGPLSARILDDADAVAAWEGPSLAAVLFPTAETLGEVRKIADARRWAGGLAGGRMGGWLVGSAAGAAGAQLLVQDANLQYWHAVHAASAVVSMPPGLLLASWLACSHTLPTSLSCPSPVCPAATG